MNILEKYFKDVWQFPGDTLLKGMSWNVLYQYVSSTYLNGVVNLPLQYGKPVCCYLIDRYDGFNETVEKIEYKDTEYTKKQLFQYFMDYNKNQLPNEFYHIDIGMFDDDILMIQKFDIQPGTLENEYVFYWFDNDISDCQIGLFKTTDTPEEVEQELLKWLNAQKGSTTWQSGFPFDYHKIPNEKIRGWIRFK